MRSLRVMDEELSENCRPHAGSKLPERRPESFQEQKPLLLGHFSSVLHSSCKTSAALRHTIPGGSMSHVSTSSASAAKPLLWFAPTPESAGLGSRALRGRCGTPPRARHR